MAGPSRVVTLAVLLQGLRELAAGPDARTHPVEDVDRDGDEDGQDPEDGAGPLEVELAANVAVHGGGIHGRQTSQQVTGEPVATGGGSRVDAVGRHHVVNGSHVNAVVRNGNQEGEDQGYDPMGILGTHGCPGEPKQTNRLQRRDKQQEQQTSLRLAGGVALTLTDQFLAANVWQEDGVGYSVTDDDGDEAEPSLQRIEAPLLEDQRERLDAREDQGIRKPRQQRQEQHDGLEDEHLKGAAPDAQDLTDLKTVLQQLIGAVDVGILARLATPFGLPVDQDGGAGLGDDEQVQQLGCTTEDELDPEVPLPGQPLLDHAPEDGSNGGAPYRGEHDVGHREALLIRLPHIGRHAQGHGTPRGADPPKEATDDDGAEIGGQGTGDLPDVDQEQGQLHDGPPPQRLTPRGP